MSLVLIRYFSTADATEKQDLVDCQAVEFSVLASGDVFLRTVARRPWVSHLPTGHPLAKVLLVRGVGGEIVEARFVPGAGHQSRVWRTATAVEFHEAGVARIRFEDAFVEQTERVLLAPPRPSRSRRRIPTSSNVAPILPGLRGLSEGAPAARRRDERGRANVVPDADADERDPRQSGRRSESGR